MALSLARNWWALALRGAAAIVFGIIALFWPPAAVAALVAVFGAYALVDGILNLVAAVRAGRSGQRWGALVFEGIVSVLVGILTLFFPAVTALALVLFVAAWSLVTGVAEVVAAISERCWSALLCASGPGHRASSSPKSRPAPCRGRRRKGGPHSWQKRTSWREGSVTSTTEGPRSCA